MEKKNVCIDATTTKIDSRLMAVTENHCMSTANNLNLHPNLQLLPISNSINYSTTIKSSSFDGSVTSNGIISHNNIKGSDSHQSINQTKRSALNMSQLSTVYATKRRRRNGKRYVFSCFLNKFR